jgi:F-type H+-transporting ATPase subunit b
MLIDWFTIFAQAVNFVILVWLLKRFLYKPILDAIDAREQRIAAEIAHAETTKAEARKERDRFQIKNEEFDRQRTELLKGATKEADDERQRLLEEARTESETLRVRWREALNNERQSFTDEFARRTRGEVFAIARKALADLATVTLEERLGEVLTRRLREMDERAKADLASAIATATEPALVRSTFDLPAEQREAIQNALNETFSAEIPVTFETMPELVSGIEFTANGQKVAWSIADYLLALEQSVGELMQADDGSDAKSDPKDRLAAGETQSR